MKQLDEQLYQSLVYIRDTDDVDLEDTLCQTFSVDENVVGERVTCDLISDGRNIPVTYFNRLEYVKSRFEYEVFKSVEQQLTSMRKGFLLVAGCSSLGLFNEKELEETLCGEQTLDFDALRKVTRY